MLAKTIAAEVQAVRKRGWSTAPNQAVMGVNTLAAPVFDHRGALVGSIAIVGSTQVIAAEARAGTARRSHRGGSQRISRSWLEGITVTYSLAVDIGGTFTDIVLRHSSGVLTVDKVLTTHHDLLEGFFAGVSNVMKAARIGAARCRWRRGPCHHHRHQRADRAQGPADGAAGHGRIPRRPAYPQRASL